MATVSKPNTFSSGAIILSAEHNENFDIIYNDYNTNITNVNIAAGAAIVDTKLAQISTASKVNTSALTTNTNYTGTGDWSFAELAHPVSAAPTTVADEVKMYAKDLSSRAWPYFREESDGNEIALGQFVQIVNAQDSAVDTTTNVIPSDDTVPLPASEGKIVTTRAITMTSTSNQLRVQGIVNVSASTGTTTTAYLTWNHSGISETVLTVVGGNDAGGRPISLYIDHIFTPATTNEITLTTYFGSGAGTATLNGAAAGRFFSDLFFSSITATEIAA